MVYRESGGLADDFITSFAIDKDDNVWVSTYGGITMIIDTSSTDIKDGNNFSLHSPSDFSVYSSGKNLVIHYKFKTCGNVTLALYNLQGKCIQRINEKKINEKNRITINTTNLSCGSYICRIQTVDGISACKKVMIMR